MLLKKNRKQLNNDKSKEKLPFHYPILLSNKNCEKNQYTRINKKAFYYIYNEYHKKYLKDKNNRRKMSKGNSIDNKNKSNNEINLSFHRKFRFIPKNKKDNKREFSNSISIHKYNTIIIRRVNLEDALQIIIFIIKNLIFKIKYLKKIIIRSKIKMKMKINLLLLIEIQKTECFQVSHFVQMIKIKY